MKKLIVTAILFGLGTGLALADGGGDNSYARQTIQQVRSGNYSAQFNQNGEETFLGR